ncbi:MAG: outer membrane protein [Acidobacteria bacterium]|nr:outer membrane protein [Acidobacteriota bacterium]
MKFQRLIAAFVFVIASAALPVLAQTKPAPAQPAAQSNAPVPDTKIALIYSEAFLDSKIGISRFNVLMGTLTRELKPKTDELQQLEQKITQLTDELNKTQGAPVDPKSVQTKTETLEAMKKDYQRKGEDAQALYTKRRGEIFQPLQDEIGKALEVYAKAHNINVIIDGSQVPVVYAADAIDITRAFIIDFNSKNPATAAVTAPK